MTDSVPMTVLNASVLPAWVDHNGHMNVAYYATLFDQAFEAFFDVAGVGRDYSASHGCAMFVVESHFTYQRELNAGAPLTLRVQLIDRDRKRIHVFLELYHGTEQYLAATSEQIAVHVNLKSRKSLSMPPEVMENLSEILDAHYRIARPKEVGHKIGMRRKKPTLAAS
ncbi:thioesterase family protein [Govanella unica]|uniref:Thioesterase family protein n=1 Tax=Govanella unica TaxID=2975056 RepID=A0A9X3Z8C6_9PROT|nr:thioesterase family protein [Govania unica]MDA5195092.1 thioesterase family protein [Govania unica]